MTQVVVVEHDPEWPIRFQELHTRIWPHVRDVAAALEHVGSTSVPGLAAKPIIDLTIVAKSESHVGVNVERLSGLGYVHRGDLGIPGREAFFPPEDAVAHHLYVCAPDNLALRNHIAVRDHLRANPDAALEYGRLKKQLARELADDVDRYTEAKSAFLARVLLAAGIPPEQLADIEAANRAGTPRASADRVQGSPPRGRSG